MSRKRLLVWLAGGVAGAAVLAVVGLLVAHRIHLYCQLRELPLKRSDPAEPRPGSDEAMNAVFIRELVRPGMTYDEITSLIGLPSSQFPLPDGGVRCSFLACDLGMQYEDWVVTFDKGRRAVFVPYVKRYVRLEGRTYVEMVRSPPEQPR